MERRSAEVRFINKYAGIAEEKRQPHKEDLERLIKVRKRFYELKRIWTDQILVKQLYIHFTIFGIRRGADDQYEKKKKTLGLSICPYPLFLSFFSKIGLS